MPPYANNWISDTEVETQNEHGEVITARFDGKEFFFRHSDIGEEDLRIVSLDGSALALMSVNGGPKIFSENEMRWMLNAKEKIWKRHLKKNPWQPQNIIPKLMGDVVIGRNRFEKQEHSNG